MKNILYAMRSLKETLTEHVNDYIPENNIFEVAVPPIQPQNIVIDFPDIDKIPYNQMIYIIPDYSSQSDQTFSTIMNEDQIKIFVFCKRDKSENLVSRVTTIYSAVLQTLMNYRTLDGKITVCRFNSADYYPAVGASNTISGYEMNISLGYVLQK